MLALGIEVTYSLAPKVLPRVHAAVVAECNRRAMRQHAAEHLQQHFEAGAGSRYGYNQRRSTINLAFLYRTNRAAWDRVPKIQSTRFNRGNRKWELTGKLLNRARYRDVKTVLGLHPLEWSGGLRRAVLDPANQKITATQHRSRMRLKTPPMVASRVKDSKGRTGGQMQREALQRHAEIQAITAGEMRSLRAGWKKNYLDVMRDPASPRHTFLAKHGVNILRQRKRFGKGS